MKARFYIKNRMIKMRSICCALIAYVLFYMAINIKKEWCTVRGFYALWSFIMITVSMILMIVGI